MGEDGLGLLTFAGLIGAVMWFTGPGEDVSNEAQPAFEAAAGGLSGVLFLMIAALAAVLAIVIGLFVLAAVGGWVREHKQYPINTFGTRTETETVEFDWGDDTDKRCVNCWGELGENAVTNMANEWTVRFGFKTSKNHHIETYECQQCHESDWFEYAMRGGEHDDVLTDPDVLTAPAESDETDTESDAGPDPVQCPFCDKVDLRGEHGLRVHVGKQHPTVDMDDYPHAVNRSVGDRALSEEIEKREAERGKWENREQQPDPTTKV